MATGPLSGAIVTIGDSTNTYRMGQPGDIAVDIKDHLQVLEKQLDEVNRKLQEATERIASLEEESVPMVEIMRRLEDLELEVKLGRTT